MNNRLHHPLRVRRDRINAGIRHLQEQLVGLDQDLERLFRPLPQPTTLYEETRDAYGAEVIHSHRLLAEKYGWSDPDEIEFVSERVYEGGAVVVLQSRPMNDPESMVQVYVYREDPPHGVASCTVFQPVVVATS